MIRLTTSGGTTHHISEANIARITEAGTSSQWHGIKSFVRCFDGETLEVQEDAAWIAERVEEQRT